MDQDTHDTFERLEDHVDGFYFPEIPEYDTSTWSTNSGTDFETDVYVRNSSADGPRVVIVGGQHGIEPAGWESAERIVDLKPRAGYLKIIPRANPTAIDAGTYAGDNGDMNENWNTGGEPSTSATQSLWGEIEAASPDLVIDLHSSYGIYGRDGDDGVGQAIFPSAGMETIAGATRDDLNSRYFDAYPSEYDFSVGNTQDGSNDHLSHKVVADLGCESLLIETTRDDTSLEERKEWTVEAVRTALAEYGLELE